MSRYSSIDHDRLAQAVLRDGHCILPGHLSSELLDRWNQEFTPLLEAHVEREGHLRNRGNGRYYVTLPFAPPFADPIVFDDDDIIAVVQRLVGADAVLCQLATDTPVRGSEFQSVHRDAPPLFPELREETPPFQLAVNFPLCDVTAENGPTEVVVGTHRMPKDEGMRLLESGQGRLEPILMRRGDIVIRDVRTLHRGTPNHTDTPRPMVVLGYSRRWLHRPEVSIRVPRGILDGLSERARQMLRFNPVVDSLDEALPEGEIYQAYAY